MSLSIIIVAALILGAIAFPVALVVALVLRRWLKVTSGLGVWLLRLLPFAAAGAPLTLLIAAMIWANIPDPPGDYRDVFGARPGPQVTALRSQPDIGSDYAAIYLAFRAPPATVDDLTLGFGARPESQANPIDAPTWWRGAVCPGAVVRQAKARGQWDFIAVYRCPDDGMTYVAASAIS